MRSLLIMMSVCISMVPFATAEDDIQVGDAVDVDVEVAAMLPPGNPAMQRLHTNLAVQRAFIARVCDLSEEQKTKLAKMDEKWLDKISQEPEKNAIQPDGLIAAFFGAPKREPNRPIQPKLIQQRVDAKLLEVLTPKQSEVFEAARKKRIEFRNRAIAEALIETLQDPLDLTDEQRVELVTKIMPWVEKSNLVTVHYFQGQNYYPEIPIYLLDALSEKQLKVYQGLQRYLFNADNFNDGNAPIVIEE